MVALLYKNLISFVRQYDHFCCLLIIVVSVSIIY